MSEFTVLNPATGQAVTTVPLTSAEQADAAIARAAAAQPRWRAVAPGDRAALLRRFAAAVDADTEELARLEIAGSRAPGRPAPPGGGGGGGGGGQAPGAP